MPRRAGGWRGCGLCSTSFPAAAGVVVVVAPLMRNIAATAAAPCWQHPQQEEEPAVEAGAAVRAAEICSSSRNGGDRRRPAVLRCDRRCPDQRRLSPPFLRRPAGSRLRFQPRTATNPMAAAATAAAARFHTSRKSTLGPQSRRKSSAGRRPSTG
jgi:hypothetical protein